MPANQALTLKLFLGLSDLRRQWAGALFVGAGLNDVGRALAMASLAAGAAGLFLEQDAAELRQAQREGCCTFSVTTLEEAVRVLKNEVRQGRGITVALSGDATQWLAEMVAHGLQPDALAFARAPRLHEAESAGTLQHRGSQVVHGLGLAARPSGFDLEAGLQKIAGERWEIRTDFASTLAERRVEDRVLSSPGEIDVDAASVGLAASRWLRVAPSLFPRSLHRVYLHRQSEF